jgi:hypothetical protein
VLWMATLDKLWSIYSHNTDIAGVASEVLRSPDDDNELLKHVGVKFGMFQ